MKWRGYVLETTDDGKNMSNYLWVRVNMLAHGGQWVGGDWVNYNYGPSSGDTLFSGVPFNELKAYSYGHILLDSTVASPAFAPGHTACYEIFVRMLLVHPNG